MDPICLLIALSSVSLWHSTKPPTETEGPRVRITAALPAAAQELLVNGDFADWTDGTPSGWQVGIGAQQGADAPGSQISQGDGPTLQLTGDAQTRVWRVVQQQVALQPGACYRLQFAARAVNVRSEGNQFDNCYVGIFANDAQGKRRMQSIVTVSREKWLPSTLSVRIPQGVTQANVMIFLSKSGSLEVRDVRLAKLEPEQSFDVLVEEMDRNYSHFASKKVDWPGLVDRYRARGEKAKNADEFAQVVSKMLAELEDIHVWLQIGDRQVPTYRSRGTPRVDFRTIDRALRDRQELGSWAVWGRTPDGWGYVRITSLIDIPSSEQQQLLGGIQKLFDAPGLVIDVRQNNGGAEGIGQQIASLFADEERIYARQRVRSGPAHTDLVETSPRTIAPREGGVTYRGPIAGLIGPGAVSSAEGFALMLKALPSCQLFGSPTRGASGNPAPVMLPNGVDVYFSRWETLEPDGTPIEGRGVAPDVEVDSNGKGDRAFEQACEWLGRQRSQR